MLKNRGLILILCITFLFLISLQFSSALSSSAIDKPVYIVPYVGDIDGAVNPIWFPFYNNITQFYIDNNIPAGFSFYPGTISDNPEYMRALLAMYNSQNIELIQKGFLGDDLEMRMDTLSFAQQKQIIKNGQDALRGNISSALGTS